MKRLIPIVAISLVIAMVATAGAFTPPKKPMKDMNPRVIVKTNLGSFTIELFRKEAPVTVANFLHYVDKKFYDGTIFHRVIPGFVIQGGGLTPDLMKKVTDEPIKNEAGNGLKNLKGTLSMARTMNINSATSQFFINLRDNAGLDHRDNTTKGYGYAVFGKVVDGWNVIEKIASVKTTNKNGRQNVPVKPIIIESMRRIMPAKSMGKK
ncbi:peptidyl-prolyl cis-trans isomerase [bacterium]|nr:MAG: peptidyl-prolyl cis-trans isomerase [bacterium]